jgi:hemerythrin-like metal-binding protein
MEILKWRESYETGVEQMDAQHKQLIQLVNQLYTILRQKDGLDALDAILQEMSDYSEQHLRDEEALLQKYGYPELNRQKHSHQEYYETIDELSAEMEVDKYEAAQKIYRFLRKWWIDHIVGEDKEYGEYLREKGIR